MKAFGDRVDDLDKKVKSAGAGWQKYTLAAGAVAGVLAGVGAAAAGAMQALGDGAALDLAASRFDNLAASIGTTADALTNQMGAATQGMMSHAAMVGAASDIISLGLADSGDEVVRLSNLVGQLGWDMQVLTLTMANDSMLRLDALGLSMENVKNKMEDLKAAGVSADEAFDLAVIEAGEEKLELLGSAADSTAGRIKQMQADWENAVNAFKVEFATSVADQLAAVAEAVGAAGPGFEEGMAGFGAMAGDVVGYFMSEAASAGLERTAKQMIDQLAEMGLGEEAQLVAEQAARAESGYVAFGADALRANAAAVQALRERYGVQLAIMNMEEMRTEAIRGQSQTIVQAIDDTTVAYRYNAEGAAYATEIYWDLAEAYEESGRTSQFAYERAQYQQRVLDDQAASVEYLAQRTEAYQAQLERLWETQAAGGDFFMAQAGSEAGDRMFNANMVTNADALNQLILGLADNAGASALEMADLNIQLGELEPAAARAMVAATVANEAISILISSWKGGQIDTGELLANVDAVIAELQNKELPAIELDLQIKTSSIADELPMGEKRWMEMMGESPEIPVGADLEPFEAALQTALGSITGTAADQRTLEILADYEAVTEVLDTKIPAAVQGIPAESRTIEFISDDAAVQETITALDGKHITVYVDYVPTGAPEPKAAGGPVEGGNAYWIGEVGPELFVPWTNGTIVPNHRIGGEGAGGGMVALTMNFYGQTDAADVARAADRAGRRLMERIRQAGVTV